MSYALGIGALIEGPEFNTVRDIQLQLAAKTNSLNGLCQPPHVTVKRPFEVSSKEEVEAVIEIMDKVATACSSFEVRLKDFDSFGSHFIYANAEDGEALMNLHHDLMSALYLLKVAPDPFEGESMAFHTTLAMGLSKKEFKTAESELENLMPDKPIHCKIKKLGLLLGLDDASYWSVIKESPLGK